MDLSENQASQRAVGQYSTVSPVQTVPILDSLFTAALFSNSDGFADALKEPAFFGFCNRRGRPAIDNFHGEEFEKGEPGVLKIKPEVSGNLSNGARAIELGSELGFGDG